MADRRKQVEPSVRLSRSLVDCFRCQKYCQPVRKQLQFEFPKCSVLTEVKDGLSEEVCSARSVHFPG